MVSESDRVDRAGEYVLGLMNDRDRERAERDLEIDPAFRETVMRLAEQTRFLDRYGKRGLQPAGQWEAVTQRLAELPQMRPIGMDTSETKPTPVIRELERRPYGVGVYSLGGRRGFVIAVGLIAAFVLGYLAGKL